MFNHTIMRRPYSLILMIQLVLVVSSSTAQADSRSPVRLSGVLFDGILKGNPEPESAIRITNSDTKLPTRIGGFALTDRYTPPHPNQMKNKGAVGGTLRQDPSNRAAFKGKKPGSYRVVRLPESAILEAGGEIWIAHQGKAFYSQFGFWPDYEHVDTSPEVPNVEGRQGWLMLASTRGTVALENGFGEVVDFVAYDRGKKVSITEDMLPAQVWNGSPVRLASTSPYGWTGQILGRDRNEDGSIRDDTDTAADWNSGFSKKQLGEEPTHRIELPGQSHFRTNVLKQAKVKIVATSAPDNNYRELIRAFESAQKEIRVSVYQFTNVKIAEALMDALARGIKVTLWMEGSPVAGIPDQERFILDKLEKAGADIYFLVSKKGVKTRYRFDHSKYTIIDDRRVIIGTENYGRTGVPVYPSFGNRGWMIHVENPTFVRQVRAVWDHDLRPGVLPDIVHIADSPDDSYGLPYRKQDFTPKTTFERGLYAKPVKPLVFKGKADLELVLSPDTSLNENTSLIGMIQNAKKSVIIQQNSIRKRWGKKSDTLEAAPNLLLDAVIEAARRGLKVRVLIDGTWYNIQSDDDRGNDDTVRYLNTLAETENLDIAAKVINLESTHLEKIHAKGVITDSERVFIGSINWSENSFKGNREVGVIVTNRKVTKYYEDLFWRDWNSSRMYETVAAVNAKIYRDPSTTSKRVAQVDAGKKLPVIGEFSGAQDDQMWLEVNLGRKKTGFIRASDTKYINAHPVETFHLIGRQASVTGRVVDTRVTAKSIQLRFEDEKRPPFVAVIFRSSDQAFQEVGINPTEAFQGREVRVRGKLKSYKWPEIIIRYPDQIEIIK